MSREELLDLLEQGLDQGLSSDEWRRALSALVVLGDAGEILAAVHALAQAADDLRAACDTAPAPPDLEAGILRALAAESVPRTAPAAARGLLDRLPGLMSAFKVRSAAAVRTAGQALSPSELAVVVAARGPIAVPEPSHVAQPEGDAQDRSGTDRAPRPAPGALPVDASTPNRSTMRAAVVDNGVVHFGLGSGTRLIAEDTGTVTVDLGLLGPPATGGWILHLERGAVTTWHPDRLLLTGDAGGLIVLPDGSMLGFGPVAEIRWT